MNRRSFVTKAGIVSLGASAGAAIASPQESGSQQLLEWIEYRLPVGSRRSLVGEFYRDVAIPALNRIGIGPVGAFTARYGPSDPTLYLLLPHADMESVLMKSDRLLDDQVFRTEGREFLEAPLDDPPFVRLESSLMRAFTGMPTVEPPEDLLSENGRIYELRIYESHSLIAAKKKIEMFNEGGEIAIFRKTGLRPVFFGETVVGRLIPNLTYMLVFDSMAARDRHWDAFRVDPDWQVLREDAYYRDTVSNITDFILSPTPYSQV